MSRNLLYILNCQKPGKVLCEIHFNVSTLTLSLDIIALFFIFRKFNLIWKFFNFLRNHFQFYSLELTDAE